GVVFFSSRRRHTRFSREWSSDVCSSDLHRDDAERRPHFDTGQALALDGQRNEVSREQKTDDDTAARQNEPGKTRAHSPHRQRQLDRKSTRLNSSHVKISYAVFCLKNKTE